MQQHFILLFYVVHFLSKLVESEAPNASIAVWVFHIQAHSCTKLVTKYHVARAGKNWEDLWLNPKLFDANINKVSVCVCVGVCVGDIDPAEQQDTHSAMSGGKLFLFSLCFFSLLSPEKQTPCYAFLLTLWNNGHFIFFYQSNYWQNGSIYLNFNLHNLQFNFKLKTTITGWEWWNIFSSVAFFRRLLN